MKRNSSLRPVHPFLFLVAVYAIALFMTFFACRTVFYSFNSKDGITKAKVVDPGKFLYK